MEFLVQPQLMEEVAPTCGCQTNILCGCLSVFSPTCPQCSLILKRSNLDL